MNFSTNKIKDIRETYLRQLEQIYSQQEAAALFDMVTEYRLGIKRIDRILNPDIRLSESEMLKIHFDIRELKKYRPVQYIFGEAWFGDLRLKVNEHVLIPRPETEELVAWMTEDLKAYPGISILDIGTGSGCIALSLASKLPSAEISACDISTEAFEIAGENAARLQLKINLFRMDIFGRDAWKSLPAFDAIVSNPPYVTLADKKDMQPNVLHYEPPLALFVSDENPLSYYIEILEFSKDHLNPYGRIYFEINQRFGKEIFELLSAFGFENVEVRKDLSGHDRMAAASKKREICVDLRHQSISSSISSDSRVRS